VQAQYFRYLRLNPTDAPDFNYDGYQFWLGKLNAFNGDFSQSEIVKSFIAEFAFLEFFPLVLYLATEIARQAVNGDSLIRAELPPQKEARIELPCLV
jgi:hypothetical protein